jgi:capsular polysaccharide biosynthesis protein
MPTRSIDPDDVHLTEVVVVTDLPDYGRFAVGAVRRRRWLVVALSFAGLALVTAYYVLATPRYRAETRILAQRQQSLPAMVRSSLAEDQPSRGAWELIHRRDNLLDLIKHAGLLEPPAPEARSWISRLGARLTPSPADEDPLEELVLRLDKRLKVETGEVTIAIQLDWPDPQQAYLIVERALQNFLEARHVQEVTAIDETIAVLQGRAETLRVELARASRASAAQGVPRTPGAPAAAPRPSPGEDLVRLKSMLEAKQRAIADVEDFRRRRLAELTAQYESRRAIYTENHPDSANLREDISALTRDSPQLAALRAEEKALRDEVQARLARDPAHRQAAAALAEPTRAAEVAGTAETERVREARRRYDDVMESVHRAQVDLDTARSAFNHRYKIIWPAQVPKKPVSPKPLLVFGIGGLASLLLALLAATGLDWRSGRVLERWQIERELGVPVLAQRRGD